MKVIWMTEDEYDRLKVKDDDTFYAIATPEKVAEIRTKAGMNTIDFTDEIMKEIRRMREPRFYEPRIEPVLDAINDGNVMPGSVRVLVRDGWYDFPEGSLPSQRVTITFDYIRLRKDKGEIPFDREMREHGYSPK